MTTRDNEMRTNCAGDRERKYGANQPDCAGNQNQVEIFHLLLVVVGLPKEPSKGIKRNENFINFYIGNTDLVEELEQISFNVRQ